MSTNTSLHLHHELILDALSEGVFTVDLDWRVTSFNRAAERITGIPRAEALGRPCCEVFRADVCEEGCVMRRTLETGQSLANVPVHVYRADKRRLPINVSTTLLKDKAGRVIGGVETFQDMSALEDLQKALGQTRSFDDIVSKDPKMQGIFSILPQVAESQSTILIQGASGTGKELVARAIHHHSAHRAGPFVAINCGALPDALIESELFGYKAGAFTDARRDKPGRFALAQNGTIFLDEIGDISPAVQVRLLRVLQEKAYEPLGSSRTLATNARVILASHRNLEQMVKEERFREDLYYRINVFRIQLPALAERKEDIPLLADFFVARFNLRRKRAVRGFAPEAMAALLAYGWPGNVRELENAVEHAFILCRTDFIHLGDLPASVVPEPAALHLIGGGTLREVERSAILQMLHRHEGRRVAAARALGIDKNTLRRKMIRLEIEG